MNDAAMNLVVGAGAPSCPPGYAQVGGTGPCWPIAVKVEGGAQPAAGSSKTAYVVVGSVAAVGLGFAAWWKWGRK